LAYAIKARDTHATYPAFNRREIDAVLAFTEAQPLQVDAP